MSLYKVPYICNLFSRVKSIYNLFIKKERKYSAFQFFSLKSWMSLLKSHPFWVTLYPRHSRILNLILILIKLFFYLKTDRFQKYVFIFNKFQKKMYYSYIIKSKWNLNNKYFCSAKKSGIRIHEDSNGTIYTLGTKSMLTNVINGVSYFPKGLFLLTTSKVATSQLRNFISGNLLNIH